MAGLYEIFGDSYEMGKDMNASAKKQEVWENNAPARELQKEQDQLGLDVQKAGDSVYGGRVKRAQQLAQEAKYVKQLDIQTKESQNAYRNAQAAKMSSTAFDDSFGLYANDGRQEHLPKMAEASGGTQNPDGSFQMGPRSYTPLNQNDFTADDKEKWQVLQDKLQDQIDSGEIEVVDTAEGTRYKIRESGQMFNPELAMRRDDGEVTTVLDPGVALGTAKRKSSYLKNTQPKKYEKLDPEASSAASPLLEKHGLRITSGFRSPEHNKSVGGAKNSKHMEGHAMDVHWKGKTTAEKSAIIKDFKEAGFTGFGVGENTLHVDRRKKGASWSYIGGTSTGGGKMPPWARDSISGTTATSGTGEFAQHRDKELDFYEKAREVKALTADQKEYASTLKMNPQFMLDNNIMSFQDYDKHKKLEKSRDDALVKKMKSDTAIEKVASYQDYINDPEVSYETKSARLAKTSTAELMQLEKSAKDAGSYDPAVVKEMKVEVSNIQEFAPHLNEIAKLYSDPDVMSEMASPTGFLANAFNTFKGAKDEKDLVKLMKTQMAQSAKGTAAAKILKAMSGASATDDEFARTLFNAFGKTGFDKDVLIATVFQGLKGSQMSLESTLTTSVNNGGYQNARSASRLHTKIGAFLKSPHFKGVNEAVSTPESKPAKGEMSREDKAERLKTLLGIQKRAREAGITTSEQAKLEGFK